MADNDAWKMATPSDGLPKGKWWEIFGDARLNALVEMIDVSNQNLKQAEAQFRAARATIAVNRAGYYPTIAGSIAITQADAGKNTGRANGLAYTFALPVAVTWEPDLWGRVRLSVENAVSTAQVSAADLENIRLSEQALLVTDYFSMAADDMQEAILRETIAAYERNLQLTIDRFNGGVASRTDVTLAQTQLASARAQYTDVHVVRAQFEHAIAVLTGQPPAALTIPAVRIEAPPPAVPISVPSQLLERRPDIAASERQMAAANASVGIAQAAFYPTLTLAADPELLASSLASLVSYASRVWAAGPTLSQTLLDFGRRGAQLEIARASYDATVASYRQTVLNAFEEVENDLSSLRYLAEEAVQQQEAVTAAAQALALENDRYKAGTDSYLSVITTQTIALGDQQTAITILQRRMTAAVDLIKALGGGWDASQLPSTDSLRRTRAHP
jgi:NodT family efflux transporter outer membrane factor (OMF) lipoprotein